MEQVVINFVGSDKLNEVAKDLSCVYARNLGELDADLIKRFLLDQLRAARRLGYGERKKQEAMLRVSDNDIA